VNRIIGGFIYSPGFMLVILFCSFFILASCAGASRRETSLSCQSLKLGERTVLFALPKGNTPDQGWPLVLLLHGRDQKAGSWFGEQPSEDDKQRVFASFALESGLAVLAPESAKIFENGVKSWDYFHPDPKSNADLAFFSVLFDWLKNNDVAKFNPHKVYIAGFSNGGLMASRLGHVVPEKIRAMAVVAGGNANTYQGIETKTPEIKELNTAFPTSYPPVLVIHGEKDPVISVDHGQRYFRDLKNAGIKTDFIMIPEGGHTWFEIVNGRITRWFYETEATPPAPKEKEDMIVLKESDSGRSISLKKGEKFKFNLKGVPTAGYQWKVEEQDKAKLKLVNSESRSLAKPGMVGGSSLFTWEFETLAQGECSLVLKHYRPWEGPEKASDSFSLYLKIVP